MVGIAAGMTIRDHGPAAPNEARAVQDAASREGDEKRARFWRDVVREIKIRRIDIED